MIKKKRKKVIYSMGKRKEGEIRRNGGRIKRKGKKW
jgi:hypothetical protein